MKIFVVFSGLWILGVKYSLILAIFAAVFELVPVVGPVFAGSLAVVAGLSQSINLGIYVLLFFLVIQQLENNFIVPQVMKRAVGLNPVIIILAVSVGGKLLGIPGALLAVPIVVVIQIVVEEVLKGNTAQNS